MVYLITLLIIFDSGSESAKSTKNFYQIEGIRKMGRGMGVQQNFFFDFRAIIFLLMTQSCFVYIHTSPRILYIFLGTSVLQVTSTIPCQIYSSGLKHLIGKKVFGSPCTYGEILHRPFCMASDYLFCFLKNDKCLRNFFKESRVQFLMGLRCVWHKRPAITHNHMFVFHSLVLRYSL